MIFLLAIVTYMPMQCKAGRKYSTVFIDLDHFDVDPDPHIRVKWLLRILVLI